MRTLIVNEGTFSILYTAVMQGGIPTKDAKLARRVVRKFKAIAEKDEKSPTGLAYKEGGALKLEETEFDFLKQRFNQVNDWLPAVIETVADAADLLEGSVEDPQIVPA